MRKFKPAGDAECVDRGGAVVAHLLVRVHVWSVDHGPRETCRILVSRTSELGSASSADSKNFVLGWGWVCPLARRMDGVLVHQSARTACLTIVGMTAPVLGSVLIGKQGSIKRGCVYACRALVGGGHLVLVD